MASRDTLLAWIVLFKAVKTALLIALGAGLLFSIHRDPLDVVLRLAEDVHLPVTSRVYDAVLTLTATATPKKEIGVAITAFGYAVLIGAEGVGLYLRRPWARWFTIGMTSSLVPLELYEIVRDARPTRVAILALNIAVVIYVFIRKDAFE